MDDLIFAEYSNQELADAINDYLDVTCWMVIDVICWRKFLEKGFAPTYGVDSRGCDYPALAGDEHSNFGFVCFLEDRMHGNWYGEDDYV